MNISDMSDEFHDWLSECPVQWFRVSNENKVATYTFYEEDE